jgi:mono/diheme cytochrome c family protein
MENELSFQLRAGFAAACLSAIAVVSAFGMSHVLKQRAMRTSHQIPADEHWFESPTPSSAALIAQGRKLFLDSCAHCHGADAHGDEGPDLYEADVSDRYIGNIITHGIPHEMPSFAKKIGPADITALTAYVRSLVAQESNSPQQ